MKKMLLFIIALPLSGSLLVCKKLKEQHSEYDKWSLTPRRLVKILVNVINYYHTVTDIAIY